MESAPVKIKTVPTQPGETVDGVYHEPPKAAPKKQYWTPKPSKANISWTRLLRKSLSPRVRSQSSSLSHPRPYHLNPSLSLTQFLGGLSTTMSFASGMAT